MSERKNAGRELEIVGTVTALSNCRPVIEVKPGDNMIGVFAGWVQDTTRYQLVLNSCFRCAVVYTTDGNRVGMLELGGGTDGMFSITAPKDLVMTRPGDWDAAYISTYASLYDGLKRRLFLPPDLEIKLSRGRKVALWSGELHGLSKTVPVYFAFPQDREEMSRVMDQIMRFQIFGLEKRLQSLHGRVATTMGHELGRSCPR